MEDAMRAIRRVARYAGVVALVMTPGLVAQRPDPQVKARVDALVQALGSGSLEQFEAMAQRAYAPSFLARHTPADRKQFVERVKAELGLRQAQTAPSLSRGGFLSVGRVERRGEGSLVIEVRGAAGAEGQLELEIEPTPPHRITGLALRVERDEPDGRDDPAGDPAIDGAMPPPELARALDAHVTRIVEADGFAGVVLVAKDGKTVFEKAYGLADRDRKLPVAPTTRFSLGSINKIFTKTAIAQLIAEGKLARTDTIGTLLPDYPNPQAKGATIDQLIEHRAGIADFFGPAFDAAPKSAFRSNADYYRFVASRPLLFEPGTKHQYCNGCYIVLGAIVERLSGLRYEDYVAERIFRPAGMTGAGFFHADRLPADVALGYTRLGKLGPTLRGNSEMHGAAGSGAGGAYASAADLVAFDCALRAQALVDATMTAWLLHVGAVTPGRTDGHLGIAGGAPGVNAVLESDKTWTVAVVGNLDPPSASRLGVAIHRQLRR
jgi:D-alanyl-D-alanine carboxypeptidase